MFFHLNSHTNLLPEIAPGLHLDSGWHFTQLNHIRLYYKGYLNEGNLHDQIVNIHYGMRPAGVWAVIEHRSDVSVVYTPEYRPYPLYRKGSAVTNIEQWGYELLDNEFKLVPVTDRITIDEAVTKIKDILISNTTNFLKYNTNKPKVIFSGGIDSLCVLAIVDSITQDYEIRANILDYDKCAELGPVEARKRYVCMQPEYETPLQQYLLGKHWGYELSGVTKEPQTLIMGFWGDEILFRNPDQINILAKSQNKTAVSLVNGSNYMYHYLNRSDYKLSSGYDTVDEITARRLCDEWLRHDYQVWHLDNNTHFSPFFDLRIFEIMRQLSIEDILKGGLHLGIQRSIIEQVNPTFLQFQDDFKNTDAMCHNFIKNKHTVPRILGKLVK